MPVLNPLFDAQLYLETWVHAVALQHQRLQQHQRPQSDADRHLFAQQLSSWLLTRSADALLLILALDQVADTAEAVHRAAPAQAKADIAAAIERFGQDCPDRRAARNAIAHMSDYLHGKGRRGKNSTATSEYAFPEFPDAFVILVEEGDTSSLLEIDYDAGVRAAERLISRVRSTLRGAD